MKKARLDILIGGHTVSIDREDCEILKKFSGISVIKDKRNMYVQCTIYKKGLKNTTIGLHSAIMEKYFVREKGMLVDHIDRNGLNNTKKNLRFVSFKQNSLNARKQLGVSSAFKGVTYIKTNKKWQATYCNKYLGQFLTELEAVDAYRNAAKPDEGYVFHGTEGQN